MRGGDRVGEQHLAFLVGVRSLNDECRRSGHQVRLVRMLHRLE